MLQTSSNGGGSVSSSNDNSSNDISSNDVSSNKVSVGVGVVVCQEVFDEHSQPTYEGKNGFNVANVLKDLKRNWRERETNDPEVLMYSEILKLN